LEKSNALKDQEIIRLNKLNNELTDANIALNNNQKGHMEDMEQVYPRYERLRRLLGYLRAVAERGTGQMPDLPAWLEGYNDIESEDVDIGTQFVDAVGDGFNVPSPEDLSATEDLDDGAILSPTANTGAAIIEHGSPLATATAGSSDDAAVGATATNTLVGSTNSSTISPATAPEIGRPTAQAQAAASTSRKTSRKPKPSGKRKAEQMAVSDQLIPAQSTLRPGHAYPTRIALECWYYNHAALQNERISGPFDDLSDMDCFANNSTEPTIAQFVAIASQKVPALNGEAAGHNADCAILKSGEGASQEWARCERTSILRRHVMNFIAQSAPKVQVKVVIFSKVPAQEAQRALAEIGFPERA
jgi:hypothetical protein